MTSLQKLMRFRVLRGFFLIDSGTAYTCKRALSEGWMRRSDPGVLAGQMLSHNRRPFSG
jgi:hypothetical protein